MTESPTEAGFEALADAKGADATYVSPAYLRNPFREFLYNFDRGIYWLRSPADTGKTAFVRGMTAKRPDTNPIEGIDSAITTDVRVIAFHIRRKYHYGPKQLVAGLKSSFDAEFGLTDAEQSGTVPEIDYSSAESAKAGLLSWLEKLLAIANEKGGKRLLVCIDGLDEAGEAGTSAFPEAYSIIDLLPSLAEVPNNIFFLLTSRMTEDWPAGLCEKVTERLGTTKGVVIRDLPLADTAYVDMLHKYFRDSLRLTFRTRIKGHLEQLLANKVKFAKGGRDDRLTKDPTLRDGLKDDWKKLTNKYPRYSGEQIPVASFIEHLDQMEKLWNDTMDRADQRFKYVAYIVPRLIEGSLTFEQVPELPKGEALLNPPAAA